MATVQNVIDQVSRKLRDVNKKTYKLDILVAAINYAFQSTVNVHPDASTVYRNLKLVSGTEQTIDDDLYKLVHILHNIDPATGVHRRSVTKANMATMDTTFMHWRQDAPRGYIEHYMLDGISDKVYHVWPPAQKSQEEVDEPVAPVILDASSTQSDIDSYNAYLLELEAYSMLPAKSMQLRVVATNIPCVEDLEEPVPPIEPVNPGPTNIDDDIIRLDVYFIRNIGLGDNEMVFEFPDGDDRPNTLMNIAVPNGRQVILTFRNAISGAWVDPRIGTLGSIPDTVFANGFGASLAPLYQLNPPGSSMGIGDQSSAQSYYYELDPVWDTASIMLAVNNRPQDRLDVIEEQFVPVTLGDVFAYETEYATYQAALVTYNQEVTAYNAVTKLFDEMPINKTYHPAIIEMMLYYCYTVDDELTANNQRGNAHFQQFFNLLGAKVQNSLRIVQIRDEANI